MSTFIPFVAYLKIVPERGSGRRFEAVRSRDRTAQQINADIISAIGNEDLTAQTVNIAQPGGGADDARRLENLSPDTETCLSKLVSGCAVKPAFGSEPAQVTVVGFYHSDDENIPPYNEKTIIHAGGVVSGPSAGSPAWAGRPTAKANADVKALKSGLEGAIVAVAAEIIKIDFNGIIYGRGGYHFPL